MKKRAYIALILSVLMVLSILTGCGAKEPEAGTITPTDAPEAQEKEVSLGRMEGGVYTNPYAGFGCSLDSSWTFYTAEELQELPENTKELLADSELGETMSEYTQITDMMAENVNDLTTINVLYTQISMAERLLYTSMSNEDIIDATLDQMDALISSYAQAGIMVSTMEKVTVSFLGEQRVAMKTVATLADMDYYILQIMDYKLGGYGVTLTLSSFVEDKTESMLELFYAVEE